MAQTIQQSDLDNPQSNQSNAQPAGGNQQYNPNTQRGSGYTNIQQIVSANQGNQLGQTIGSDIQQSGQQAQGQLNQAQQQFNQQTSADQANTAQNAQLAQSVLANPTGYAGQTGQQGQQANQFQQLLSGAYQGPTGLNNAQQLQSNAQNVGQMGQALNTAGGRAGLLQQFVGNPQYNQGQQTLDAVLLGQSNAPQLAAAKQQALQLQGQTQNAITGATATAQQQAQQAQQFGQALQGQFGQTVAGINSGLQQQAAAAQQQANQQYQQTIKALQSGNINQQQASLLGLTQGEQVTGNQLQNIGNYLQENPQQATAQNVASQQQYNQIQALQQLAGNYAPQQAQQTLQQFAGQQGQAGSFYNNPVAQATANDVSAFNTANQGAVQNYNQQQSADAATRQNAINQANGFLAVANAFGGGGAATGQYNQLVNAANNTYNQQLAGLNSQTGGLQTINITPQQAALQQLSQGQS